MIPQAHIVTWKEQAPWVLDAQVEQDLVLSRAVVEIFSAKPIRDHLAFRGGTALNKLVLKSPARYSEDIDLVQIEAGPIGNVIDAIRRKLDGWLGEPTRERSAGRVTLRYRFDSEATPPTKLRLKIEINTREHFSVLGIHTQTFNVDSRWFAGSTEIPTYRLEEMLGTKLRALYQRKKGRDLFDIAAGIADVPDLSRETVVRCFQEYMEHGGHKVSRAQYERNLAEKAALVTFTNDLPPLLSAGAKPFDYSSAFSLVQREFISLLPGAPWTGAKEERGKQS